MRLSGFIAGRYLFAGKSHNVINVISAISAIGMAIGTAAIILILSVYNGFDKIIDDNVSVLDPDVLVIPATGKSFTPDATMLRALRSCGEVSSISEIVEENIFVTYDGRQAVCRAKGVDREHERANGISLHRGELDLCHLGQELASELRVSPYFSAPMEFWYPDRTARISAANPAASLLRVAAHPEAIFSLGTSSGKLVILPIESMRTLMKYTDEVSALEVRLSANSNRNVSAFIDEASSRLGPGFILRNRYQQNESLYKMMKYEKAAIFLILLFVVFIVAFNIFGSLRMLIIEKEDDMHSMRCMGAGESLIRRIFLLEGWFISLLGLAAGLLAGVSLALVQQHFGLVKMPGNYLIDAYPVIIHWTDVLMTAVCVAAIGFLISLASSTRKAS